jgi:hypothetical protein
VPIIFSLFHVDMPLLAGMVVAAMNETFDVVIYRKDTMQVDSVIGSNMRRHDGNGNGRNTAELRRATGIERVNEYYDAAIVPAGKYVKSSILDETDILP